MYYNEQPERSVRAYEPYVRELEALVATVTSSGPSSSISKDIASALDGGARKALRNLVDLDFLRASGAFFTGSSLARLAWEPLAGTLDNSSVIADPACGAGNLLLPGLAHLCQAVDHVESIPDRILGCDIFALFAQAAKVRLYLALASSEHFRAMPATLAAESFQGIQTGDALQDMVSIIKPATHVILNPPYNYLKTSVDWASGSINSAAIFVDSCLNSMRPGTHMVAILPEVLRSGSRYTRWREKIESAATVRQISSWGLFDDETDVNVFVLHLTKNRKGQIADPSHQPLRLSPITDAPSVSDEASLTVSTFFSVSVGTVVPHRHPESGPLLPFATAKLLPAWETVGEVPLKRRFAGACAKPPFVAVRRTSRPGQTPRARATVITGSDLIAVDNHLLVLSPHDGTESRCQEMMKILQSPHTTRWLDERFQCRHLPVNAVKNIPWPFGQVTAVD